MEAVQPTRKHYAEIALIAFAALLLEICYTRVFSFKLFYYFAYFVIGLTLLGFGSGGVAVALSPRLRRMPMDTLIAVFSFAGAALIGIGYIAVARIPLNLWRIEDFTGEMLKLSILSGLLFGAFLCIGIIVAAILGRETASVSKLYCADLIGAGLGCAAAVPLLQSVGATASIFISAGILASAGVWTSWRQRRRAWSAACMTLAAVAFAIAAQPKWLPEIVPDEIKHFKADQSGSPSHVFSKWTPLFRLDLFEVKIANSIFIHHDGQLGTALHEFDGDFSKLTDLDTSARAIPFRFTPPNPEVLVIGAAGGYDVRAALYFDAKEVTAVELNPVTVDLVTNRFADYVGHIAQDSRVEWINDEGRAFLGRQDRTYDLIYFVAPDSYASVNAASSSAFVLSESYLYTREMVEESLDHLSDDGLICMQFGEFDVESKPLRTTRYLATVREAFARLGMPDPEKHVLAVSTPDPFGNLVTILVRKTPFPEDTLRRFVTDAPQFGGSIPRYAWTGGVANGPVKQVLELDDSELAAWMESYPYDVTPVTDNSPFFWHFVRLRDALTFDTAGESGRLHADESIGIRVLVNLLTLSVLMAGAFLLLPLLIVRRNWSHLPHKFPVFIYFAALGLGFMFIEVTLIQKLTLYLGYPTRSLSVTLMGILIFTGIGSFISAGFKSDTRVLVRLFAVVTIMCLFYAFGLPYVIGLTIGWPVAARMMMSLAIVAPAGIVLGAFMPIGLRTLAGADDQNTEYVAWGWAVNGFFSVIGSVLTTVLAIGFGFQFVLILAVMAYAVGVAAFSRMSQPA